jgi:hypothetical protein
MVFQDILSTILVQAEARNKKLLAASMDSAQWLFGLATMAIAVTSLQGHNFHEKILVIACVTVANFAGTFIGTAIGERWVKE